MGERGNPRREGTKIKEAKHKLQTETGAVEQAKEKKRKSPVSRKKPKEVNGAMVEMLNEFIKPEKESSGIGNSTEEMLKRFNERGKSSDLPAESQPPVPEKVIIEPEVVLPELSKMEILAENTLTAREALNIAVNTSERKEYERLLNEKIPADASPGKVEELKNKIKEASEAYYNTPAYEQWIKLRESERRQTGEAMPKEIKEPEINPEKIIEEKEAEKAEAPNTGSEKLSLAEFKEKIEKDHGEFFKKNRFREGDPKKAFIYVEDYDPETGEITIFDSLHREGKRGRKRIKLNELDNLLAIYKSEIKTEATKKEQPEIGDVIPVKLETEIKTEPKEPEEKIIDLTDLVEKGPGKSKEEKEEIIDLVNLVERGETPELENLRQEVERTRSAYAKKDYELTNVFTNLKGFFGKFLKTTRENIPDTSDLYGDYKAALNGYLSARVEALKNSKMEPTELKREMGDLVKFFNQDEKIELFDSRTKARADYLEEKMGRGIGKPAGWMINGAKKFFHWYEKTEGEGKKGLAKGIAKAKGIVKRSLFNYTLTAVGLGFTGVAVPVGAGIFAGKRVLAGTAMGVGTARILEGHYRKKESERMAQERDDIMKDIETSGDPEKIFDRLMEKANLEMDGYEDDIRRELKGALKRKVIGLSVGVVAAVVLPEVFRYLGEKTGVTELIREKVAHYFGSAEVPAGVVKEKIPTETFDYGNPPEAQAPEMSKAAPDISAEAPEVSKNIDLTIKEGSNFQGAIINYLTEHGIEKGEAGKMAHRMWDDFAEKYSDPATKDYSLIQPGSKLELGLDSDGKYYVASFQDSKPGSDWIGDPKAGVAKMAEQLHAEKAVSQMAEELKAEDVANNEIPIAPKTEEPPLKSPESSPEGISSEDKELERAMLEKQEKLANSAAAVGLSLAGAKIAGEILYKKERAFKTLAKKYSFEKTDDLDSRAGKAIKGISLNSPENWSIMKNLEFSAVLQKNSPLSSKLARNIRSLEKEFIELLGKEAKHRKEETIKHWLARNVNDSVTVEKTEQKLTA